MENNSAMTLSDGKEKKVRVHLLFIFVLYQFQDPISYGSWPNGRTDRQTDGQAQTNMSPPPNQLLRSWGHKYTLYMNLDWLSDVTAENLLLLLFELGFTTLQDYVTHFGSSRSSKLNEIRRSMRKRSGHSQVRWRVELGESVSDVSIEPYHAKMCLQRFSTR